MTEAGAVERPRVDVLRQREITQRAGIRSLLGGRFDAVNAVAGSQLLEGAGYLGLDLVDQATSPQSDGAP